MKEKKKARNLGGFDALSVQTELDRNECGLKLVIQNRPQGDIPDPLLEREKCFEILLGFHNQTPQIFFFCFQGGKQNISFEYLFRKPFLNFQDEIKFITGLSGSIFFE